MGACAARTQGAGDSGAIGATEDAAARVHSAFRRPVLVQLEVPETVTIRRHLVRASANPSIEGRIRLSRAGPGIKELSRAADARCMTWMRRLRADESGIALIMALGIVIVLGISVTTMVSYTTSNTRNVAMSSGRLVAVSNAESAANSAISLLTQTISTGADPSAANLLGCAGATGLNDTNGPSNCASPTPKLICLRATTCTAGTADTATLYGYYSGLNGGTFMSQTVPSATSASDMIHRPPIDRSRTQPRW